MKKFTPIIIAVILALFCRIYLISMFKVPSQSMAPTLIAGDYVLGTQIYSLPADGDLVVFVKNSRTFVKRVIAVSGAEIEYKDGGFYLNGAACSYTQQDGLFDAGFVLFTETCANGLPRKILKASNPAGKPLSFPLTRILPGEFLVASDNRDFDSNYVAIEVVRADQIVGKPLVVWMSYASTQDFISKTSGVRWNRILTILR